MLFSFFKSFFETAADRQARQSLQRSENIEPYMIWSLIQLLAKSKSKAIQIKIAETLHCFVLEELKKPDAYFRLCRGFGHGTWREYEAVRTKALQTYKSARKKIPDEYLSIFLILASLSDNGYIREKAVREWKTHCDSMAFPFLVNRLSDWVPQVRHAAWDSLSSCRNAEFLHPDFLKHFYWFDRLLYKGNAAAIRFGEKLVTFVMSHDFSEEIGRHLKEGDQRSWKTYVDHSIDGQLKSNSLLFETVRNDSSPAIRSAVIRVLDDWPEATRLELLREALQDKSQPCRSRALYYIIKHLDRPGYEQLIDLAAFDVSPSLREAARHYLKNRQEDWRSFYKSRIDNQPDVIQQSLIGQDKRNFLGNLGGFCEFATEEDIPFLERFLAISDGKMQTLALEAIHRLNPVQGVEWAKKLLCAHAGYLGRAGVQILGQKPSPETLIFARELAQSESVPHRVLGLKLLNKIGGWNVAADLIRASVDSDKGVQHLAGSLLENWIRRFSSHGWIKPKEEDVRRVIDAVECARLRQTTLPSATLEKILFFFGIRGK